MAEGCLPPRLYEGLLLGNQTLKLDESAAIYNPIETLVTDMNYDLYFALFWQSRLSKTFLKMIHVFLMFKRPAFGYKTQPACW